MEARDGQHDGVVANALRKFVPPSLNQLLTSGIVSNPVRWSSVKKMRMFGNSVRVAVIGGEAARSPLGHEVNTTAARIMTALTNRLRDNDTYFGLVFVHATSCSSRALVVTCEIRLPFAVMA